MDVFRTWPKIFQYTALVLEGFSKIRVHCFPAQYISWFSSPSFREEWLWPLLSLVRWRYNLLHELLILLWLTHKLGPRTRRPHGLLNFSVALLHSEGWLVLKTGPLPQSYQLPAAYGWGHRESAIRYCQNIQSPQRCVPGIPAYRARTVRRHARSLTSTFLRGEKQTAKLGQTGITKWV